MVSSPWVRIKQIVSLILLAYAGADLFVPGICRTDDVPPAVNSVASLDESHGPETPGSENPYFDDCFCCSPHCSTLLLEERGYLCHGAVLNPEVLSTTRRCPNPSI